MRKTGASKGRADCHWHTPAKHFRFRSKVEVDKFLMALKTAGDGDEKKGKTSYEQESLTITVNKFLNEKLRVKKELHVFRRSDD